MSSTFLGLFVSGLAISGLIVTAYILFVITLTKQANTVNGMLLVQLAVVEFLLSFLFLVCSMPRAILKLSSTATADIDTEIDIRTNDKPSEEEEKETCDICGVLFTVLRPISVWTVCGLNCDRYYAISAPLHYGSLINPRKTMTAICVVWIVSFVLCVLPFFYPAPYLQNFLLFACIPDFTYDVISACYTAFLFVVVFLLPLILILTCNAKIFLIARYHKHRIASAIFEVTLSAQVTITHQRNPFRPLLWANKFRGRSAFFTVLQLVGAFLLIYVPYYCVIFWESINNYYYYYYYLHYQYNNNNNNSNNHNIDNNNNIYNSTIAFPRNGRTLATGVSSILIVCSSTVNGLLYGVKSKPLRKSFQNYWRKKTTKNELNQEIQARTPSTCGSRRPSLTPFGFFSRQPTLRRPSESSIDTQRSNLLGLQQCLNEIAAFRPASSPSGLGLSGRNDSFAELRRTRSFRTNGNEKFRQFVSFNGSDGTVNERIRFAGSTIIGGNDVNSSNENSPLHLNNNNNNNNNVNRKNFARRSRKLESGVGAVYNKLKSRPLHSPRILITRAFSEEKESATTGRHSPTPKQSSSVTALTEVVADNCWMVDSSRDRIFNYPRGNQTITMTSLGIGDEQLLSSESQESSSDNEDSIIGRNHRKTSIGAFKLTPPQQLSLLTDDKRKRYRHTNNINVDDNVNNNNNNNNNRDIDNDKKQTIIDTTSGTVTTDNNNNNNNNNMNDNKSMAAWTYTPRRKSIKFHIGTVLLSDRMYSSTSSSQNKNKNRTATNQDTFV